MCLVKLWVFRKCVECKLIVLLCLRAPLTLLSGQMTSFPVDHYRVRSICMVESPTSRLGGGHYVS